MPIQCMGCKGSFEQRGTHEFDIGALRLVEALTNRCPACTMKELESLLETAVRDGLLVCDLRNRPIVDWRKFIALDTWERKTGLVRIALALGILVLEPCAFCFRVEESGRNAGPTAKEGKYASFANKYEAIRYARAVFSGRDREWLIQALMEPITPRMAEVYHEKVRWSLPDEFK